MHVMGIDMGTTTVSLVLIDIKSGEMLHSNTVEHHAFIQEDIPGAKIQDVNLLWNLTKDLVISACQKYGKPESIGLTGQMHGMLYVDKNGDAVSPLYTWQDARGNSKRTDGTTYAEALKGAAGFGLVTHFCLQETNGIPDDACKMVTIPDYIGMKLCGLQEPVIASDMAASWGVFDLEQKCFKEEILRETGVDQSYLPKLCKAHEIMGKTILEELKDVPVVVSLGDNQASVLGSVQDLEKTVLLNIGTGSQVSIGSAAYHIVEGGVELRPCGEDGYIMVGCGLCGGRAYAMLHDFYKVIPGQREENLYAMMEAQARKFLKEKGKEQAWAIKTTFAGTRQNPTEKGTMEDIDINNFTPGAMTVGMLQGILKELYDQYQMMVEKTKIKAENLVGSGNGIRKNALMRELAEELFGMKIRIPKYTEEAACGAALYSLLPTGICGSLAEVQKLIQYNL